MNPLHWLFPEEHEPVSMVRQPPIRKGYTPTAPAEAGDPPTGGSGAFRPEVAYSSLADAARCYRDATVECHNASCLSVRRFAPGICNCDVGFARASLSEALRR